MSLARAIAAEMPALPVILMTAGSDGRDETLAQAWLDKPFSREALLAALTRVVDRP